MEKGGRGRGVVGVDAAFVVRAGASSGHAGSCRINVFVVVKELTQARNAAYVADPWLCGVRACVFVGFRLALLTYCSHQRHAQVRAIRSTVNHPSRRARGAGRWSIVTRPCANRGPRSDRARASVDEWAVRTSTVPPCRRHPAHAGRNRYRSRYRRVVRERDRPHTWRWTGQRVRCVSVSIGCTLAPPTHMRNECKQACEVMNVSSGEWCVCECGVLMGEWPVCHAW